MSTQTKAPDNAAIILVDTTNDFCPGGPFAVPDGDLVVPVYNRLAPRFTHRYLTQDWHDDANIFFAKNHPDVEPFGFIDSPYSNKPGERSQVWPLHCIQGTPGADFHPDLDTEGAIVFRKGRNNLVETLSAFVGEDGLYEPTFDNGDTLEENMKSRGIAYLVVGGLSEDYCAGQTALDGARKGFGVIFVSDMARGVFPEQIAKMHDDLRAAGAVIMQSVQLESLVERGPAAWSQLFSSTGSESRSDSGNPGGAV